ncbi:hypothetical protein C1708_32615 [Streptomyces sp. DH-12]|nr:hypothetical protein C1708_32615 [Streptomyces sp. DH-12]
MTAGPPEAGIGPDTAGLRALIDGAPVIGAAGCAAFSAPVAVRCLCWSEAPSGVPIEFEEKHYADQATAEPVNLKPRQPLLTS